MQHPCNAYPVYSRPVFTGTTFGSVMPERVWTDESRNYRFGFNGQEKDNEISREGNSYTAEFWQYDSRLGRRWNVDPVEKPWESSYLCFTGNPILFIDPNGDDSYVDEDGNFLGNDGDPNSHEVRVITKEKWEEIVGKRNGKGEYPEVSKEQRDLLQNGTHVPKDDKGNVNFAMAPQPNSKLLVEYEKGIKIVDETWGKIIDDDKKVKRLTPFVQNNSNSTIYYKPEGSDKNGNNLNPYVSQKGAYPIAPNTDLYSPVDGVKTPKTGKNNVHKVPDEYRVKIDKEGNADITNWPDCCIPGYGETSTPKDGNWDALRDAYK
jgi:RHS repeat-associated protein